MTNDLEHSSKLKWNFQEQSFLKELRQQQNLKSWKLIAQHMNQMFQEKNRSAKQCRERYINYVRFDQEKPKILSWNREDDLLLFEKFLEIGPKWVEISHHMEGRSENSLKNRFYGSLRRAIRKINKIEREKKFKCKKSIKSDSLIKVLSLKLEEETELCGSQTRLKNQLVKSLQIDITELAVNQGEKFSPEKIQCLIRKVHDLNCLGRPTSTRDGLVSISEEALVNFSQKSVQKSTWISTAILQDGQNQAIEKEISSAQSALCMQIIDDNDFSIDLNKEFDQEPWEIIGLKYSPLDLPYF